LAAANGIPVIANRVGGIPEALGESRILIETGRGDHLDIERLAKRYFAEIRELLRDGSTCCAVIQCRAKLTTQVEAPS